MGGGPKKEDTSLERDNARQQLELGKQLAGQGQARLDTQKEYESPLVGFLKSIIGGDQNAKLTAAAVPIGQIAKGAAGAREGILDTQPAGAGRDFALASLQRDQAGQKAGALNSIYMSAFPTLAGLGAGDANIGLQTLGGGLRASAQGGEGLSAINNRAAQQKSSTLGLLGGLAGTAGNIATGGGFGLAKKAVGTVGDIAGGVQAAWPGGPGSLLGY